MGVYVCLRRMGGGSVQCLRRHFLILLISGKMSFNVTEERIFHIGINHWSELIENGKEIKQCRACSGQATMEEVLVTGGQVETSHLFLNKKHRFNL